MLAAVVRFQTDTEPCQSCVSHERETSRPARENVASRQVIRRRRRSSSRTNLTHATMRLSNSSCDNLNFSCFCFVILFERRDRSSIAFRSLVFPNSYACYVVLALISLLRLADLNRLYSNEIHSQWSRTRSLLLDRSRNAASRTRVRFQRPPPILGD